ncbi:methionine--tRNA ligase [Thermofilum pendens]|uniref:Methionine--tRNA ligase n=1 Tax=Thermofilum pendens (strain DSM 2475 / Hrk 5) TaxID=368408 RepID=SYM_THEPD|nr:RecName: Full=Methionine--tRNA ligase; AltName: Full=Methionyl-tRNA synthetase; Short=MetRS [Thermofilum pendens Hrk 5]ABL78019.1 methionyl-tRNA synthetase [Thermofilum pendens Hrk 5]
MGDKARRKWLVLAAWPYAYGVPHLGNLIGSVLSADVAARFLRLAGDEVVFVSGSDMHGTPIEVEALKRGESPKDLAERNHEKIKELFERWEISFDNYSKTESPTHIKFVQDFYRRVYENGYVFSDTVQLYYCPKDKIFLPDRYIVGTCPYCGYDRAYGDQCENCGRLLEPTLLLNPRCAICGSTPELRTTTHWFFDLPKLTDALKRYIEENENLPPNARNMSLQILRDGLKPRALTRDNKWGIPAPFPGAEDKTIYVWMEAVLGYISATIEYFASKGEPEKWKEFWLDPETRSVYFIGKDNIPFHTLILPALLIASGEKYVLPWTVASTEYLLFRGLKFSKSRRIGVWIDEALEVFPADYWRFVLVSLRPEQKDMSFTWEEFLRIVNNDLNDNIGNFVHRVLVLVQRKFGGIAPAPLDFADEDLKFREEILARSREVAEFMYAFRFKEALTHILWLSSSGNSYLNFRKPWELDSESARTPAFLALHAVKALAIMLYPIIPRSSQEMWKLLGYKDDIANHRWHEINEAVPPGQELPSPRPLFRKISEEELKAAVEKIEELRASRSS